MRELITVIVPVYNAARTIKTCAKCLTDQSFGDYEVIFVNDGSTDESEEILKQICAKNDKFQFVTTENGGAGAARNVGMDKATGDYICFVDADDVISENYLKQLHDLAVKTDADVVCAKYAKNKTADFELIVKETEVISGDKAIDALLQMKIDNGPVAKLFKRDVIGKKRMPNYAVAEDLYFNYEVFKDAKKIAINDSVMYSYLIKTGSLTKRFSPERMGSLEAVERINDSEKSFYSKARLFMEAYFICEAIILAKATEQYSSEYGIVCNILERERGTILRDKRATRRQKLVARLLGFGPKLAVKVTTAKQRVKRH